MKLTDRAKKRLTLAGLGVVCIILVIAIASQFKTEELKDAAQPSSTASEAVSPSAEIPISSSEVNAKPIDSSATNQSADTGNSTGTEQSIQAEVTKPTEPSQEAKTDPQKTPDGEKAGKVSPTEHDKVTKPENSTSSSTPKAGDKNDKGQVYFPGFGWIDDEGGGASGTTVGDMYENGNKIGDMK